MCWGPSKHGRSQHGPSQHRARTNRRLRALFDGSYKFIWASDGRHELYNVDEDPLETTNLISRQEPVRLRMEQTLRETVAAMNVGGSPQQVPALTEEQRRRLESLGYLNTSPAEHEN